MTGSLSSVRHWSCQFELEVLLWSPCLGGGVWTPGRRLERVVERLYILYLRIIKYGNSNTSIIHRLRPVIFSHLPPLSQGGCVESHRVHILLLLNLIFHRSPLPLFYLKSIENLRLSCLEPLPDLHPYSFFQLSSYDRSESDS